MKERFVTGIKYLGYLVLAIVLLVLLLIPGILTTLAQYIYRPGQALWRFSEVMKQTALSIDGLGNVLLGAFLNAVFCKKDGHRYGRWYETISQVTGENELKGTLTRQGVGFKNFLNWLFEPDHCRNAVMAKIKRCQQYLAGNGASKTSFETNEKQDHES